MDWSTLVTGGLDGLSAIAQAFRTRGIPVTGIYLLKWTSPDGDERWTLRMVSDSKDVHLNRRMITQLVALGRDEGFPRLDSSVQVDIVPADDSEASRVMTYTQRLGGAPQIIRNAMSQGLFIEFAAVALAPERDAAAA